MGKEYNDSLNEKNVVLIYSNGIYLPIIHIYGDLPDNFIFKCVVNRFKVYNKLATETDLSLVEMNVATSSKLAEPATVTPAIVTDEPSTAKPVTAIAEPKTNKPTLKGFSGYKLPQLQDLANEFGISIWNCDVESNKSKPKTKRQLYDQLKAL